MTAMARTDIHRPSAPEFDPETYSFLTVFDLWTDEPAVNVEANAIRATLHRRGTQHGGPHGLGKCDHCGTTIRYAALMVHTTTDTYIYVGETCLDGRFSMSKELFTRARKRAELDRKAQKIRKAFDALCATNPDLVWATYAGNIGGAVQADGSFWSNRTRTGNAITILQDIAAKVRNYGTMSAPQGALVSKLVRQIEGAEALAVQREAERKERDANATPAVLGKQVVTGTVVKVQFHDSEWGGKWAMTIVADAGYMVWGTIPSHLSTEIKGSRIELHATLEHFRNSGDLMFVKGSRPTRKTRLLDA
jgi:hypothetical protein